MTSSPALHIDFVPGRLTKGLWIAQVLVVLALFVFLPWLIALGVGLFGVWMLVRAWPMKATTGHLLLLDDATARWGDAPDTQLVQAQNYLGVLVLCFADRRVLWLWPDMLDVQVRGALLRWLKSHMAQKNGAAGEGVAP